MISAHTKKYVAGLFIFFTLFVFVPTPSLASSHNENQGESFADRLWDFLPDPLTNAIETANDLRKRGTSYFLLVVPTGLLVSFSGIMLDFFVAMSLDGATYATGSDSVIYNGWTILRDFANIFFIFALLYIGISSILGVLSRNMRSLLITLIIVALFVNFSLVLTGVVIDAANIIAVGFYNAFPDRTIGLVDNAKSLSWPFVQGGGFTDIISSDVFEDIVSGEGLGEEIRGGFVKPFMGLFINLLAAFINLVAFFVLFGAAILFAIRTVVLIMVMILSPLAITAYALPETRRYGNIWLNTLLKNAFWAPVFMILYYITTQIYTSTGGLLNTTLDRTETLWAVFLQFIIVVIFMISTIVVSQKIGAYGAGTIVKYTQKYGKKAGWAAGGAAGRHTIGRAAHAVAGSNTMKNFAKNNPRLGAMALQPLKATASASFGGRKGGYEKALKDQQKKLEGIYKDLESNKDGDPLGGGKVALKDEYGIIQRDKKGKIKEISKAQAEFLKKLNRPSFLGKKFKWQTQRNLSTEGQELTEEEDNRLTDLRRRANTGREEDKLTQRELDELKELVRRSDRLRQRRVVDRNTVRSLVKGKKDVKEMIKDELVEEGEVTEGGDTNDSDTTDTASSTEGTSDSSGTTT